MRKIAVATPEIKLDSFLKWAGVTGSGGQAKELVAAGHVKVNGVPEPRRGRRLHPGDTVEAGGETLVVETSGD